MTNCNNCGSTNVYGMSRVVGYYSIIENWNGSKQAELVDRQNGDYKLDVNKLSVCEETVINNTEYIEKVQQVIMVH